MLITTMNDIPGYRVDAAAVRGANAVGAMRFDTTELGGNWTEICAYGTACRISPVGMR